MPTPVTSRASGLAQFLITRFGEWSSQRKRELEPKLQADLNAVIGVDDMRRKPFKSGESQGWRSDAYLPATRVKVFTAFAILQDVLLQGGRIPYALKPSPFEDERFYEEYGIRMADVIDDMEDKIQEQLRDRNADREYIKKLLSLCIYGMAWSKYDIAEVERTGFVRQVAHPGFGGAAPVVAFDEASTTALVPGHIYVSVWNMFWDMEDEEVQKGSGVCERDYISAYDLRQLKGDPDYVPDNLERVLSEATGKSGTQITGEGSDSLPPFLRDIENRKRHVRRLRFWGRAPRNLVERFEQEYMQGMEGVPTLGSAEYNEEDSGDDVEIMAVVANDEVVKLKRTEAKDRPYRRCTWRISLDELIGMGIADDVAEAQYILNGLLRAFIDNKRLSANVILALKRQYLANPASADEPLEPGKKIELAASCDDARKAIQQVVIQDVGASLLDGIGYFDRWKDTSSIPEILQGATLPKQQADTAYELSQLQENAGRYLGAGLKNVDEQFIEPEITDIYRYNMMDPAYTGEKGSFIVHAIGFPTFKDKIIKAQKLKELLSLVLASPMLTSEARIRPFLEEIFKASDVDPDVFLKTEEEKQAEADAQEKARLQVADEQSAMAEKQVQTKAKADAEAKSLVEASKAGSKMQSDRTLAEDEFQRDILKEGIAAAKGLSQPETLAPQGKRRTMNETVQ
jgi:hypothetical protein